ncbi:hypothetical protein C9374_011004 [Naegleria lovaniensis]|uniref:Uncharacterized protein n=1 Tax=Naegleria lovaniensis TaxID=51637 RepID=A0AA88KIQ3_NAELO|nr:uncharacterized protein C9374_011004 [Naegleria lovaniensis]KAG2374167.1 hypothetical protein C9374_011004 [Naegleria lovaniensis]
MYEKVLILYHTSNNKFKQHHQNNNSSPLHSGSSRMRSDSASATFRLYNQAPPLTIWSNYEHNSVLDLLNVATEQEIMADGGASTSVMMKSASSAVAGSTSTSTAPTPLIIMKSTNVHHHDEMVYGGQVLALKD